MSVHNIFIFKNKVNQTQLETTRYQYQYLCGIQYLVLYTIYNI